MTKPSGELSSDKCHCGKNGHPLGSINCPAGHAAKYSQQELDQAKIEAVRKVIDLIETTDEFNNTSYPKEILEGIDEFIFKVQNATDQELLEMLK